MIASVEVCRTRLRTAGARLLSHRATSARHRHRHRHRHTFAVGLGVALAALLGLLFAAPAFAKEVHVFKSSFGAGELSLVENSGVAVDQPSGDVYVADTGHGRVAEFGPDGTFIRAFGSLSDPTFLSVDNSGGASEGDVYVADGDTITKFDHEGNLITGWATGGRLTVSGEVFAGIAVDPSGDLWVYGQDAQMREFSSSGAPITEWNSGIGVSPDGTAVDSSEDLYVVRGSEAVAQFSSTGAQLTEEADPGPATGLAVDPAGDDLYVDHATGAARYSSAGASLETAIGSGEGLSSLGALALAPAHVLYAAETASSQIARFVVEEVEPPLVAIDPPSAVEYTSTHVSGTVDPEGHATSCSFEYVTDQHFAAEGFTGAESTPCATNPGSGSAPVSVEAALESLHPSTYYHVRLVATNPADTTFSAEPSPTFETEAVARPTVTIATPTSTSTTAHFTGTVDPGAPSGPLSPDAEVAFETAWHFECEPACPGLEGVAAAGGAQPVEAEATGLIPGTAYKVTLVASDAGGTESAGPRTFSTATAAPTVSTGTVLGSNEETATLRAEIDPDGAATSFHLEYVSEAQFQAGQWAQAITLPVPDAELPAASEALPVLEHLVGLAPATAYRFRFVATNPDGGPVAGPAADFTTAAPGFFSAGLPDGRAWELVSALGSEVYLPQTPQGIAPDARTFHTTFPFRAAASGNLINFVAEPPVAQPGGSGATGPGLGDGWMSVRTPSGWHAEDMIPTGANFGSNFESFTESGAGIYVGNSRNPSVTPEVEAGCGTLYTRSSVSREFRPLFTHGLLPKSCGSPLFAGASRDESQLLFQDEAALVPGSEEVAEADLPPGYNTHYSPNGVVRNCQFGCNLYLWQNGTLRLVNNLEGHPAPGNFGGFSSKTGEHPDFSQDISGDGSRIFWTDTQPGARFGTVYLYENGTNVAVSGSEPAQFWTATSDGRYAFYTEAGALWRFEAGSDAQVRLTSDAAEVQGVIGANLVGRGGNEGEEDGAYLYFVADGVLTSSPNSRGETAAAGDCPEVEANCNLYVLTDAGPTFIARLSQKDDELIGSSNGLERSGDWKSGIGQRVAAITPDGTSMVFESIRNLTPYPNLSEETLTNPTVYVYSADQAELSCVSCSPTGSAPDIQAEGSEAEGTEGNGVRGPLWSKLPVSEIAETYTHRYISDSGARAFFDTRQPLVPQDTNGTQDVYEWERPARAGEAENSCSADAASPITGGCTYLLSGGSSAYASFLVDADASGRNVFFEHVGPLGQIEVPVGQNQLFDARVGGGFPHDAAAGCVGVACGFPSMPSADQTEAPSASLDGPGNEREPKVKRSLKACKKYRHRAPRKRCEAAVRKRFHAPVRRTQNLPRRTK